MNQVQALGQFEAQFFEILSKAIDKTMHATVTASATPDTEFTIEHGLGSVPLGFLVISKDRACDVYLSATAATESEIFLKCNTASAVLKIVVF
jgi:hypothetical protein